MGLILFLMLLLLYGLYLVGLARALDRENPNQPKRTTKAAAFSLAMISVLGMFYGLTKTQILEKGAQIASGFATIFAVIVGFIIFITIRALFSTCEDRFLGADMKNVGSFLGLGLALWIVGNVSGNLAIAGFGQ